MEAIIPLAQIKDLIGAEGAFEFELSHGGIDKFNVVGQPESTQPGKGTIGNLLDLVANPKDDPLASIGSTTIDSVGDLPTRDLIDISQDALLSPDSLTTVQQPEPEQPAPSLPAWKKLTENLVDGKSNTKNYDPDPSVDDLPILFPISPTVSEKKEYESKLEREQPSLRSDWDDDMNLDGIYFMGDSGDSGPQIDLEANKWVRNNYGPWKSIYDFYQDFVGYDDF